MGLFNHELAFDLDDLKKLRDDTKTVCGVSAGSAQPIWVGKKHPI